MFICFRSYFDVMSTTGEKLALLYIALRFESLSGTIYSLQTNFFRESVFSVMAELPS